MQTNLTVFQIKKEHTREHGGLRLEELKRFQNQQTDNFDMSVYKVVMGEINVSAHTFFPLNSNEIPDFLFEVTNNPARNTPYIRDLLVNHFGFKGRSISVGDIVRINTTYYYCDAFGWAELTPKKETVPHWITIGMQASGTYHTDVTPFEVVKLSPSGKTITIRELDWKVVKGSEQDGSAEYEYTSNPNNRTYTVRKSKHGLYKTPCNMRIYFGAARRYYDPHY